jgi:ABC-type transport system involved in multi-copper enzyme maturation permease subunit
VSTRAETSDVETRRGARLGAYAFWQLRDYLLDRGVATLLITALTGYLSAVPAYLMLQQNFERPELVARYGSAAAARVALAHEASVSFLTGTLGVIVFLGALLAMNGIVANDRKLGYFRFLFSKPMSPARYYGQAFAVHTGAWLAIITLLAFVYGLFIAPLLSAAFLGGLGLVFVCYAGVAFLLSATARWDWLSLVFITVMTTLLQQRFGMSSSPFARLLYLLPPLQETTGVYQALADGVALPWHSIVWLGGYGGACFVAALVVLRHRRLAII